MGRKYNKILSYLCMPLTDKKSKKMKVHPFPHSVSSGELPHLFTYPFHYTPHPLCVEAAEGVQAYLKTRIDWQDELQSGKMFGVLIVQTKEGEVGYLAAFSGILSDENNHDFFVPPVYDLLQPDGFFRVEEENISAINARIRAMEENAAYLSLLKQITETEALARETLAHAKAEAKACKEQRERLRQSGMLDADGLAALVRESQHQKAELKRLERRWKEETETLLMEKQRFTEEITSLKQERKVRSAALQQRLFEQFRMLNAHGEVKDLCDIFRETDGRIPPAGAGECAAPKLLQYAYLHELKPLAMAEFWWGNSPKTEIRHHGYFYPSCKGKCEPILRHMLIGLEVEPNPLEAQSHHDTPLEIVYEDDYLLVVNKPAGMLSVPGKGEADSVQSRMRRLYPEATGPLVVHRLDMATSGLLLVAKTKEVHQHLQAQFKNRTIKKRYIALLQGIVPQAEGIIDLPLCLNPLDRPRQVVDEVHGKPAITRYEVLKRTEDGQTLVAFYPLTGRTHQLRVHAAHPLGLHCPIVGDELYGQKAERLCLHAERLEFTHPANGERFVMELPPISF